MWLIDTTSLVLEFVENSDDYEYVILSHTWEGGEVSFQEITDLNQARNKPGFSKADQTCRLARERGIKYAWVDTCCIDKSSSAELTEAINSMYHWYRKSEICFVYLSDLPMTMDRNVLSDYLPRCRWFSRGWTLQELIAPRNIQIYDRGWNLRGNKVSLQQLLCEITGIDTQILEDSDLLPTMSVAKRMSWAAKRRTLRVEDMSYCLFGLFDIHLPLIYGEGWKAFIRLQEAIASENNDLSLFAWTSLPGDNALRGILAKSINEFRECGSIERNADPAVSKDEFSFTNKGFHIDTYLRYYEGEYQMSLHCFDKGVQEPGGRNASVVIHLMKIAHGYVRIRSGRLAFASTTLSIANSPSRSGKSVKLEYTPYLPVYVPKIVSPMDSKALLLRTAHRFEVNIINTTKFACHAKPEPHRLWDNDSKSFITDGYEVFTGMLVFEIRHKRRGEKTLRGLNNSWWYHTSKYAAVFGLEKGDSEAQNRATGVTVLMPWATLYEHDGENEVSRIISHEANQKQQFSDGDISQLLVRVGAYLRTHVSTGGQRLPRSLTMYPHWSRTNLPTGTPQLESFVDTSSIELSVSAEMKKNGSLSMYEGSLKITESQD